MTFLVPAYNVVEIRYYSGIIVWNKVFVQNDIKLVLIRL